MTSSPAAPAATDHDSAVREVFREVSRAWAAGDATAFTAWYAPDASVVLPGYHLAGEEQIRSAMAGAFAGPLHGTRRVHDIERIRLVTPDVALVHTSSATVQDGQYAPAAEEREAVTWVLARHAGRWLIEAYHSSPAGAV
ncbi:SgcJ/EcaC family oxidoreductase [Actinacidiphila bryophytorum]|uniref:SgcJ/EcaC family oxidoreductase n=1 Tax=Actinacidiphila bryophytorum TaxID=1436133 RepID=A0A9W4EC36_9ACTN|nr:SgcJ/EcaC family oxidoreductase [Actinacidiphila bryophytorum]MBM9436536.1 SgcJ/EcaC family oxidoreductase [Actinacidiphila bryophytorum]MBN6542281.1 SgcJ/EcaC family oxidoreductase [Actinacidiphila bryophytorum]CAG7600423.1 SgcJ/EcaC family oxidoreductase [Actinacidiphila bryophytorum]